MTKTVEFKYDVGERIYYYAGRFEIVSAMIVAQLFNNSMEHLNSNSYYLLNVDKSFQFKENDFFKSHSECFDYNEGHIVKHFKHLINKGNDDYFKSKRLSKRKFRTRKKYTLDDYKKKIKSLQLERQEEMDRAVASYISIGGSIKNVYSFLRWNINKR